jgi:hypothetical protein
MLSPGTKTRVRAAWDQVRAEPPAVWAHPVLLREDIQQWLSTEAPDPAWAGVRQALSSIRTQLEQNFNKYVLGTGPIEALWADIGSGVRSMDSALAAAAALAVTEGLTPAYVYRLLHSLTEEATRAQTWRTARDRGRIVLAAVAACDRRDDPALQRARDRGQMAWAKSCLTTVPDREMLNAADSGARRVLESVVGTPAVGLAEFELAALWGDPYLDQRNSASYEADQNAWITRGWQELGQIDGRDVSTWQMPEPLPALTHSIEHWRAARAAEPADAATLIALIEASNMRDCLAGKPPDPVTIQAVKDGLALGGGDLLMRGRFESAARGVGLDPGYAVVDQLIAWDSDRLVTILGTRGGECVLRAFNSVTDADPARAAAIVAQHLAIIRDPAQVSDAMFIPLCQRFVDVLNRLHGSPDAEVPLEPDDTHAFSALADAVMAARSPDSGQLGFAAIALAMARHSPSSDCEQFGLDLVRSIATQAPYFARRYHWLIDVLYAHLINGEGVSRYRAGDRAGALSSFAQSLSYWVRLERREMTRQLLVQLTEVSSGADAESAMLTATVAVSSAPKLTASFGAELDQSLGRLFGGLLGGLIASKELNTEFLWALLQYYKGLRTAMLLDRRTAIHLADDFEAAAILAKLADPGIGAGTASSLRSAFEHRREQLLSAGLDAPVLLELWRARFAIDQRTVIASTATAFDTDGGCARVVYAVWDDGQEVLSTGPQPDQGERNLVPTTLFGLLERLSNRGKNHLCIIDDGLVHRVPWHQVDLDGHPLADDWIISLLPHPHLLLDGRDGPVVTHANPLGVLTVGLDHPDPSIGLPDLPDAQSEAIAIANHHRGKHLVADDATVEEVLRLLPTARRVHLATHGLYDETTPAFHSLVLRGGVLAAWQVSELDLSAVDLVTLSACNTARIASRSGDNVDGLPIAFLAAGVRAVIGTTTEISGAVSALFFETLYHAISAEHHDLRDAFRAAQTAARQAFPRPEDWASFYLLGDWRTP